MTKCPMSIRDRDKFFLKTTLVSILLLTILHVYLSITLFDSNSSILAFLNTVTIVILIVIFLSIMLKGIVPVAISSLGLVLLYGSMLIPTAVTDLEGSYHKAASGNLHYESIIRISHGFFLLGVAMVVFALIVAYKPSALYTQNRPVSYEHLWSKYPKWEEKLELAGTNAESIIRLTYLLRDREKYLVWRYEFILVMIYGTIYRAPIYSFVPESSIILREPKSDKIIGMQKYGYFA